MSIGKGSYFRRYRIGEALSNLGTRTAPGCIYGAWIFFGPTWDAVVGGRRIALTPDALEGRVSSVIGLVAAGAVALGPLAGGLLVEAVGGPASFVCLAAFGAAIAIGGTLVPSLATLERRASAATGVGT
jgi:hypothetical protein